MTEKNIKVSYRPKEKDALVDRDDEIVLVVVRDRTWDEEGKKASMEKAKMIAVLPEMMKAIEMARLANFSDDAIPHHGLACALDDLDSAMKSIEIENDWVSHK